MRTRERINCWTGVLTSPRGRREVAFGIESPTTTKYEVATPKHLTAIAASMAYGSPEPGRAASATERKLAGRPTRSA